jgi:hypothetical protein
VYKSSTAIQGITQLMAIATATKIATIIKAILALIFIHYSISCHKRFSKKAFFENLKLISATEEGLNRILVSSISIVFILQPPPFDALSL